MTTATRPVLKTASWIGLFIGLGIAVGLVAWRGADTVAGLLASTRWTLVLVAGFAVPNLLLATASWRLLFPPGHAPRFSLLLMALWITSSINLLLPVASLGGDVVGARLLILRSVNARDAVASLVVDKTVQVATLPLLGLIGLAALLPVLPDSGALAPAFLGAVLLATGLVAFLVVAQRAGTFAFLAERAERLARGPRWKGLVARATDLDGAILALYRRPARILGSCGLRLLARLSLVGEVWLAAWLLGHPISLAGALALKSLALVARAVAFPVPAGVGVQEGSFVAVGALLGLAPEVALATSLATRVREIVSGVPALLVWEYLEGRALWRRRAVDAR